METARTGYRFDRQPLKRRRGKKLFVSVFAFVFLLLSSGYVTLALNKDVQAISAEKLALSQSVAGTVNLTWPTAGQSAIGTLEDGVLATSKEIEAQKPIASITKLITVLTVLEKQPLKSGEQGKTYTIGSADVANYQSYVAKLGSVVPVNIGQTLTEQQVLQALLVASANNLADSLVVWEFGSMENFLTIANQMVKQNGWQNTVVVDASGFSAGNLSTPTDLIKIGQRALQNPIIAGIVSQKELTIPGLGTLKNTNQLLNDADVVGIKTGTTDEAGSCLLFAVKYGPAKEYTMLGAVMGQPNWPAAYSAIRILKDTALANFKEIEVLPAGVVVGSYNTPWGEQTEAVTASPLKTYGWVGKQYTSEITLEQISAPLSKDQKVGKARVSGTNAAELDVVAKSELTAPNLVWKLANYW